MMKQKTKAMLSVFGAAMSLVFACASVAAATVNLSWSLPVTYTDGSPLDQTTITSSLSDLAENPDCFEISCLICLHNRIIITGLTAD
jgi:hypothetical protein